MFTLMMGLAFLVSVVRYLGLAGSVVLRLCLMTPIGLGKHIPLVAFAEEPCFYVKH